MGQKYRRFGTIPVQKIIPLLGEQLRMRTIRGHKVSLSSHRLLTYKYNGIKCQYCGVNGEFFAVEGQSGGKPHLNLYGYKGKNEVMLTSDHIIPKSRGGKNHYSNRQCLCRKCNGKKGNQCRLEQLSLFEGRRNEMQRLRNRI